VTETLTPYAPYFYIRIPRKEQLARLEKVGSIFLPPNEVHFTRGMQWGEIVAVGDAAHEYFPEAQKGQLLLIHWFVEADGKDTTDNRNHFVMSDEKFNYYVVSAFSYNGKNNETYGIYDGEKIIPNKEYIFLEIEQTYSDLHDMDMSMEGLSNLVSNMPFTMSAGGLVIPKKWKPSRTELYLKLETLKAQVQSLSKSNPNLPHVAQGIHRIEAEMNHINHQLYQKMVELYKVAAINPAYNEFLEAAYGEKVDVGDEVLMLNIACDTKIEFFKKEYIVAKTMHVNGTKKWMDKAFFAYLGAVMN
jgi:chaperonin cofactor prefoldin